jgi:hypothetical protein
MLLRQLLRVKVKWSTILAAKLKIASLPCSATPYPAANIRGIDGMLLTPQLQGRVRLFQSVPYSRAQSGTMWATTHSKFPQSMN